MHSWVPFSDQSWWVEASSQAFYDSIHLRTWLVQPQEALWGTKPLEVGLSEGLLDLCAPLFQPCFPFSLSPYCSTWSTL